MNTPESQIDVQRSYYASTARSYDEMHVAAKDEHYFALSFMTAIMEFLEISSVLDIGSGTGRAVAYVKRRHPGVRVVGIEPVAELREAGYRNGMLHGELRDGDALRLDFPDGSFDLVCEFAVLHHIRTPDVAVAEMLRVARNAVFLSDSNNFGQGPPLMRAVKQMLALLGLWRFADLVKTRGRGFSLSEGDGLAYSYSVFSNYRQIARACRRVHLLNTMGSGINPYRTAGHVALLGIK